MNFLIQPHPRWTKIPECNGGVSGAGNRRRLFRISRPGSWLVLPLLLAALVAPIHADSATLPLQQYSVTLAWTPSPDVNVVGYRVYYGGSSGNYTNATDVGNASSFKVSGLMGGIPYYFAVTAYIANGLESDFSGEIGYTPAIPNVQLRMASGRQFVLTVGGQIGHTYNILASQNLTNWTVIGSTTLGASGTFQFTDTNAGSFRSRFYRTQDTAP